MMKTSYYKYRPLYQIGAGGALEPHPFTQSLFERAEIYYSAPKDFNDPFDCNLRIHTNGSTDEEWGVYLDKLIEIDPAKAVVLRQVKREKWWNTKPEIKADLGRDQQYENYNNSSVFCLAKKGNSIPMFSYYADSHRGIAVEFRFSDLEVPCGIPCGDPRQPDNLYERKVVFRDVEYPPTYPELNYFRIYGTDRLLRGLIFTKHHEWAHEKEFRIFRRKVPASKVAYDRSLLSRVIFGCKTTTADVTLVKGWLGRWPTDVVLSKAVPATDQFDLRIDDIDIVKAS